MIKIFKIFNIIKTILINNITFIFFFNALKLSREFKNAQIITSSEGDHQFFLKEAEFVWNTIKDFTISEKKLKKTIPNEHE